MNLMNLMNLMISESFIWVLFVYLMVSFPVWCRRTQDSSSRLHLSVPQYPTMATMMRKQHTAMMTG